MFNRFSWFKIFDFRMFISGGGSSSSTSSFTSYTERDLTVEELELLESAKKSADANVAIAKQGEVRSQELYDRYKDVYQQQEENYLSKVNDVKFGESDKRLEKIFRGNAKQSAEIAYSHALRQNNRSMSARGISANSGIAVASELSLANQKQQVTAQGQNQALYQAIQQGDMAKQAKLNNLANSIDKGTVGFNGSVQYQGNAIQGNNSAGSVYNSTFNSWDKRFKQQSESHGGSSAFNFGILA